MRKVQISDAIQVTALAAIMTLLIMFLPYQTEQATLAPEPVIHVVEQKEAPEDEPAPVRTEIFEITAYSYSGSRTASGTWPKVGCVASDWNVLPPGTKIYVPGIDYYGVVEDRGGAIRGQKLDLYMSSEHECIQFGRQRLEVQILEVPNEPST